jgi:protein-tyrosine phosphatase
MMTGEPHTLFAVIDLHCHVLPGVDDGPASTEDSVALCRAAAAAGTRTIVATPHVNWEYPGNGARTMHAGVAMLNRVLAEASIEITVRPGAELGLTRAGDLSDGELGVLGVGAGSHLLVECPYGSPRLGIETALMAISRRGKQILLGHPERSLAFQRDPELLEQLVLDGMLACITARSLTGRWGRDAKACAWGFLEAGLVHVIASDAHDAERRPPDLGPELARAGLDEREISYFTQTAPQAIITGEPVPAPPAVKRARSRWGWAGARR